MVNTPFDSFWSWLRSRPQDSFPGFQVGSDAADPGGTSIGLSNWRPPNSVQQSPWLRVEPDDDLPGFRVGAGTSDPSSVATSVSLSNGQPLDFLQQPPRLRAAPPDDAYGFGATGGTADPNFARTSVGLSNWRPPASADQQTPWLRVEDPADVSQGLANWRPPPSLEQPPWIGVGGTPNDTIDEARAGNANLFPEQPWWLRAAGQAEEHDGASGPRWPWLRAETGRELPAFGVSADASTREERTVSAPSHAASTSSEDLRPAMAGTLAATADAATAGGTSGVRAVGEALSKVAGIVGRIAPSAAGAGSAVAGALPLLLIPTNTQSETIDLEDGVRARVSPGQRTVEIERRVGSGLFGTGLGARWERLPVDAEMRVGKDGAATLAIDQAQLRQALEPTENRDATTSEMARQPDKRKDGASGPSEGTGQNSGDAPSPRNGGSPDPNNGKAPDPNNRGKLPIWEHVLASTYKILRSGRQRKSVDEERIDTCRKVMKSIGQPAPEGQYLGPDGRETKAGVRLGPDVRDPAAGLDHYPEHQHLRDGVRGEQELVNRIRQFNPKEKIIHFGAAAGTQGPDIMSISEKGEVAFWDSKWRNREQSIPPSRRTNPTQRSLDNLKNAEKHIKDAVADGTLSKEVAAKALANLITRNFLLCTVGMGKAHQGVVEIVKDGQRTGPLSSD